MKSILLSDEIHKKIKQQALDENTTMLDILKRAIEDYIDQHKKTNG